MPLFRRGRVKAKRGERVYVKYDDDTRIDFADINDAFHHLRIQGVTGAVELCRDEGGLIYNRSELDKELAPRYG